MLDLVRRGHMKRAILSALIALSILPIFSQAAVIAPLATFGGGDGWLAPGEGGYTFSYTLNAQMSLRKISSVKRSAEKLLLVEEHNANDGR